MILKVVMLKNSEFDCEHSIYFLLWTRICWSIFYCCTYLSISPDVAGEWEMTSRSLKRGLRCWFFSCVPYDRSLKVTWKDIFHLCVVLVKVVASCSLLKIKLPLLVLITAKNLKIITMGDFILTFALNMNFQEAAPKGSSPWGTTSLAYSHTFKMCIYACSLK